MHRLSELRATDVLTYAVIINKRKASVKAKNREVQNGQNRDNFSVSKTDLSELNSGKWFICLTYIFRRGNYYVHEKAGSFRIQY